MTMSMLLFLQLGYLVFFFSATSLLILSKITDINAIIEKSRDLIRTWIYKKYDFDPLTVEVLQTNIAVKTAEIAQLQDQIIRSVS